MPEPPHLTALSAEEQRLYSKLLPEGQSFSLSLRDSPAHFSPLYPQSCSFGHYPKLVAIGEGRNEDRPVNRELYLSIQLPLHLDRSAQSPHHCRCRTDPPVNLSLHFRLIQERKLMELLQLGQDLPPDPEKELHLFPAEIHGLRFGGADSHLDRFAASHSAHNLQRKETRSLSHHTGPSQHPAAPRNSVHKNT